VLKPVQIEECGMQIPGLSQTSSKSPVLSAEQQADQALRIAARKLEAGFLAEMLKSAGAGKSREAFGGGVGEDQFSSFMVEEQAEMMVAAGGIGLSEQLFEALKSRSNHGN
jgi:peptidoglycan hydrolase FlgJ